MIFVFRNIVYDSALIHQYADTEERVKDIPIKNYSPDTFDMWVTSEYASYNYVYIPHMGRYFYIDIEEYKNKTIRVKLTCDYGRTFGDVIANDFIICEDSLERVQAAHIPTGGHLLNDTNILYLPRKESVHKLNRADALKVIALLTSGIIINFEDYEPESYIPPAPPVIDTPNGQTGLQPVDLMNLMNQQ